MSSQELRYKSFIINKNLKNYYFIFKYFINNNFKLKSYLLIIKDLLDVHLGVYINKVLLKALKEYNIEYNIIRYLFLFLFNFFKKVY